MPRAKPVKDADDIVALGPIEDSLMDVRFTMPAKGAKAFTSRGVVMTGCAVTLPEDEARGYIDQGKAVQAASSDAITDAKPDPLQQRRDTPPLNEGIRKAGA